MVKRLLRASVNLVPSGLRPLIRHVPGVAAFQRAIVNRFIAGAPFVHTVNAGPAAGLRFEVTLPLDKAVWSGTYEPEFTAAIVAAIPTGGVCYDIGGYRGYVSGAMALAGASRVLVFEPLPANQNALRKLRQLNQRLPIEIMPMALGNGDGRVSLQIMPDSSMAKLASSSFQRHASFQDEIEVDLHRIDSLVEAGSIPAPDLMKIDVEGAELDVLRGAARTMAKQRPRVFLEAHSRDLEQACRREFSQLGYRIRRLGPEPSQVEQTRHLVAVHGG